ncbi:MAG: PAS domain S-box protein [Coriobacteriia bacterium]|nr:PAS domain S-box protein [Coriobacteriia bacterium]
MIGKSSFGDELLAYLELLPITTIIVRMPDAKIIWGNPSGLSLIGATDVSRVVGKRVLDLIPPEQHGIAMRNVAMFAAGAKSVPPYVYTLKRLDGTTTSVHIESTLITFKGVLSMLTMIVDVSERENTLSALAESEERYRSLVESSPDAIFVCTGDEIVYANPSALIYSGAQIEDALLGLSIFDLLTPGFRDQSARRLEHVYANGGTLPTVETAGLRLDGTMYPAEIRTTLITWQGEPAVQVVMRDISARKAAEAKIHEYQEHLQQLVKERTRELEEAMRELDEINRELMQANTTKDSFLAAMSHELRTPLNSVIGFSAILQRGLAGELNEEQAKQVGMINDSGRQLLALVGNVLDLECIESGHTEITVHEFSPADVAMKLVEMLRPQAEDKQLRIKCTLAEGLPAKVRTDQLKLEQILMNLLANAIKYTQSGKVTLDVCADKTTIRFAVSDTGPGVQADQRDRIFEEFYQFSTRTDIAKPAGAGLGLAIAKRLSEMLDAKLWLDSEVGKGSIFTLELPLR